MAQLYLGLAFLLGTVMFCFGEGQGVRDLKDDTLFEGNHYGSCVCQQSCHEQGRNSSLVYQLISTLHKQAEASVGHSNDQLQIVAERLYEQAEARIGQSIARLQNFADRLYELAVYKVAESRIEQTRGLLQNFANRSEITLQEMAFSFENKTAATGDKVEILQQAVDELTQKTITDDGMDAMLQRMGSSIEVKIAAKVESLQQAVGQLTEKTITDDRMDAMLQKMGSIEVKMAAKVESLQQAVEQLTQDRLRITCPADFVYNIQANICFKFYTKRLPRADASTFCQNLIPRARLVVLDTNERLQLVQEHVSAHYGTKKTDWDTAVWLGGMQEENEGQWLWETGQVITGPWGPQEPNNAGGNEDCVDIRLSNGWILNDIPCSATLSYICEY